MSIADLKVMVNSKLPGQEDFKTLDVLLKETIDLLYLNDLSTYGSLGMFGNKDSIPILAGVVSRNKAILSNDNYRDILEIIFTNPNEQTVRLLEVMVTHDYPKNLIMNTKLFEKIIKDPLFGTSNAVISCFLDVALDNTLLKILEKLLSYQKSKDLINDNPKWINKIYGSDELLSRFIGNNIWDIPNLTKKIIDNADAIWNRVTGSALFTRQTNLENYWFNNRTVPERLGGGGLTFISKLVRHYDNSSYKQTYDIKLYHSFGSKPLVGSYVSQFSVPETMVNKWFLGGVSYTAVHTNPDGSSLGFQQNPKAVSTKRLYGKGGWQ